MKTCIVCGKVLVFGSRKSKFCSDKCKSKPRCKTCGTPLPKGRRKFCSDLCSKNFLEQKRQQCRDKGVCVRCLKRKTEHGYSYCRRCLNLSAKMNKRRIKHRDEQQCSRCLGHNPMWQSYFYCPKCLDYMKKYRESSRDRTGYCWSDYCARLAVRKKNK